MDDGGEDHGLAAAQHFVDGRGENGCHNGGHQKCCENGCSGGAGTQNIGSVVVNGTHDQQVQHAVAQDIEHIDHPALAAQQHLDCGEEGDLAVVLHFLFHTLTGGEVVGEGTGDADNAHDDGGAEEGKLAFFVLQHIAGSVQTAEQIQQGIQSQRADGRADAAA